MTATAPATSWQEPRWITSFVRAEPRAPLMVPYLAYLLLLMPMDLIPPSAMPVAIAVHAVLALWITALFRNHLPPLGRWHLLIAVVGAAAATYLWVAGQHALDGISIGGIKLGGRLPFYPGEAKVRNPHDEFGDGALFWSYAVLKILRACTAVPVIEELFWRGFILRAFIRWDHYDQVPWGAFAWRAFVGSALLSTVQHPDNWGVSIGCWLLFNGLFYGTKSLRCLIATHSLTNLLLYGYVLRTGDWRFW